MTISCEFVEIREQVAARQQPQFFVLRPAAGNAAASAVASKAREGTFWVPVRGVGVAPDPKEGPNWAMTCKGDNVRVPLHAYRTPPSAQDAPASALAAHLVALGIDIGMKAVVELGLHAGEVLHVQLLIGSHVDHVSGGLRAYVGMAVRTA